MVEDIGSQGGGFFVRDRYHDGDFGEGIGEAQDVLIFVDAFERTKQVGMNAHIRTFGDG